MSTSPKIDATQRICTSSLSPSQLKRKVRGKPLKCMMDTSAYQNDNQILFPKSFRANGNLPVLTAAPVGLTHHRSKTAANLSEQETYITCSSREFLPSISLLAEWVMLVRREGHVFRCVHPCMHLQVQGSWLNM